MKYALFIAIQLLFFSCDPALRLQLITKSPIPVHLDTEQINCDIIKEYLNKNGNVPKPQITLELGKRDQHTFYLGIGGWRIGDTTIISECLEKALSLDSTLYQSEYYISHTIELKEFGNSLMRYVIEVQQQ